MRCAALDVRKGLAVSCKRTAVVAEVGWYL